MIKRLLVVWLGLAALVFGGGCNILGWVVNPGPYDRKVTAEFDIKERAADRILVVVDESPGNGGGSVIVRKKLALAVETLLVERAKVDEKYIVSQEDMEFLGNVGSDYHRASPVNIASQLGAGLVLYVKIVNYKLYASGPEDYYVGSLMSRCVLIDSASGEVLWPTDGEPKLIRMAVDLETRGRNETQGRLVSATAHGIVRYLYDIRVRYFKTSAEQVQYDSF